MTTTAAIHHPPHAAAPGGGDTMAAIVQEAYGTDPERVLRVEQIAIPQIADDEVLVRVGAAGVDRGVWHLMAGLPRLMRIAGFGVRAPKQRVPGTDLAGTVEAVGRAVTEFAPGDAVFGTGIGTFAGHARAKARKLAAMPANLTFEQAAAVPVSAQTALQAVRDAARVQPGQTVLVIGASGGVGSFAVQIATAFGAEVTGMCSTPKVELVRALGAAHVIDYTREDAAAPSTRYDAIIDIGGNRGLARLRRALAPRGTLVIVGGEGGGRWLGGIDRQLRAHLLSAVVGQTLGTFIAKQSSADLLTLRELIDSGAVAPLVERTYALAEVPAAIRHLTDGRARGKLVIAV